MTATEHIDEGIENPLTMDTSQQNNGYEEFFGGTIPCPSCRGVGRIPRGRHCGRPQTTWVCLGVCLVYIFRYILAVGVVKDTSQI